MSEAGYRSLTFIAKCIFHSMPSSFISCVFLFFIFHFFCVLLYDIHFHNNNNNNNSLIRFVARQGIMFSRYKSLLGSNFHFCVSRFKFSESVRHSYG